MSAGGTISLDAGNNLSILASHLDGQNIGLTAFNELLIASGEESSIREVRTKSGGFLSGGSLFSSTESLNGVAKITADSSTLNATGNLVIDAGSATVIGSKLNAGKGMHISTDIGDIKVLAAKETERNYAKEETMKVGFGDVFKSLTKPGELIQTSGGQLTVKLSEASYDKVDFESTAVEQKGSELSAGENLTFNSVADILLEGATVKAKGNVNLIADGNVTIKEAETTYSETKAEVHGKADLSLVVQHQAVEVVKAAEAVDQAKDQVKQAEADYRKYQKERDQLEGTLAKLEADYQNKVPGVSYNDILELRTLLDDIKGDEAWYQAGIATASANLVSKSTLLLQQTAAAAQSSATYGFNAGLQLNIAATKTDSSLDMTGSLASSISGNNINILTGGDGQKGTTLIQGSHLAAIDGLNIYTGELNVLVSQDTMRSETDTQSGTLTIAQTVWGAAGGPTVNGSFNSTQQQDKQTTHTNSSLTADSLNIVTTGDANIIGGNLHGASLVNLNVGGDLTLESVQDRLSGSSKGFGISGGTSFGGVFTNENGAGANSKEAKTTAVGATGGVSGVNGGVNASNSRYQSTETLLSSITGGTVAIDVNGHTQLNGALIAALDAEGKDTGNLSLTTGSFAFNDLTNKSYSSSQSFGVSANLGLSDKANAADPAQSSTESTLNSSTYSYQNQSSTSVDKTLATIGQGNITVGGEAASPEGLNRDADAIHKELYSIDRTQGNIDLTVDHRLLSEDGRKQIAQDAEEVRQKSQVTYIILTEDATTGRDIKTTAIDEAGLSWGDAKKLLDRDDVKDVAEAADKFNDALVWAPKAAEEGVQNGSVVTNEDGSTSLEIVITDPGKGKLHNVVDVAGDVAEKLELVDPKVAAVVELGLAAAQGVKSVVKYVAEQAISGTPLGELWAKYTQDAGKIVSDAATGANQSDREWMASHESLQHQQNHMDKGGMLLAGIGVGIAGSGGITAAIKNVGSSKLPTLPDKYTRNADGSITGRDGGRAVDTGYPAPDGSPIYQRQGESGPSSYYWIDKNDVQQPIRSPKPKTDIGEKRDHHNSFVDQKVTELGNQGDTVVTDGSITGSCGTTCKPDIFHISPNGKVEFVEVKTGNAGLSENQAKVFKQIGVDASGSPQYIIPPDAVVPSGKLMDALRIKPGQTLAEAGYPHGIPVKIQREPGV